MKKFYQQFAVWQNGGFGAFLETKMLNQSSGIFSNASAEKPPLRQAANCWQTLSKTEMKIELHSLEWFWLIN